MPPQGQQGQTSSAANFVWLLILIALFAVGVWFFKREWIVATIFAIKSVEIYILLGLEKTIDPVLAALSLPDMKQSYWWQWHQSMVNEGALIDYTKVQWDQVVQLCDSVGFFLAVPFSILTALGAYLLLFCHPGTRFGRVFSMNSLRKQGRKLWPYTSPVQENLVNTDITKGPWAMAELPMDFCKRHKLLRVEVNDREETVWAIDKPTAEAALAKQLGVQWTGIHRLPEHARALAACFLAKIDRNTSATKALLEQIARSSATGVLDFEGVDELLKKYEDSKALKWLEKRHAYVYTLMASMLDISRSEGVLASADFLWLKPLDRPLWYMLNSVGRQTAVIEAAGPFAHWLAEKRLKRPLRTPMVGQAVSALAEEVANILYTEAGDSWHTSTEA